MTKTPPPVQASPASSNSLVQQIEELQQLLEAERQEATMLRDTQRLVVSELERQVATDLALRAELRAAQGQLTDLRLVEAVQEASERQLNELRIRQALREQVLGATLLQDVERVQDLAQLRASLGQAEQLAQAAQAQRAEADWTLEQKKAEIAALQKRLETLEQEQQVAQQDARQHQEENARLKAELTKIYGSNSWRLTEPMRSVRSKLRGPES